MSILANLTYEHKISNMFGIVNGVHSPVETPSTIWLLGSDVPNKLSKKIYPTVDANIYIASTSVSDINKEITVVYNDSNNIEVSNTIILNGQTPVLVANGIDCNEAFISGDGQTLEGNVFIAHTDAYTTGVPDNISKTLAYIDSSYGRTQQACFRVPSDSKFVLKHIYGSITNSISGLVSSSVILRVKPEGGSWTTIRPYNMTTEKTINLDEDILFEPGSIIEVGIDSNSDTGSNINVFLKYTLLKL